MYDAKPISNWQNVHNKIEAEEKAKKQKKKTEYDNSSDVINATMISSMFDSSISCDTSSSSDSSCDTSSSSDSSCSTSCDSGSFDSGGCDSGSSY